MYRVVYKYDYLERKRVEVGFEAERVEKEEFVGDYETLQEAKRHPNIEIEKTFYNGVYEIKEVS